MAGHKVTTVKEDEPPNEGEGQPTEEKAGGENEEDIAPLHVQHGVEKIAQVATFFVIHFKRRDLNVAFFRHQPFSSSLIQILLRRDAKHCTPRPKLPFQKVDDILPSSILTLLRIGRGSGLGLGLRIKLTQLALLGAILVACTWPPPFLKHGTILLAFPGRLELTTYLTVTIFWGMRSVAWARYNR